MEIIPTFRDCQKDGEGIFRLSTALDALEYYCLGDTGYFYYYLYSTKQDGGLGGEESYIHMTLQKPNM